MSPARRARASLLLAGVLAAAALSPERPSPECRGPRETRAQDGFTVAVRCGGGAGETLRGPARLLFGAPLDANRAPARALEALPGIGPARARALVRARAERPFCASRDLERAVGIGPALRRAIEPSLRFGCSGEADPPIRVW